MFLFKKFRVATGGFLQPKQVLIPNEYLVVSRHTIKLEAFPRGSSYDISQLLYVVQKFILKSYFVGMH